MDCKLCTFQIESLSLTFHGHDLIVDSELELNYGRYYMSALEAVFNCDEERLRLEKEAETLAAEDGGGGEALDRIYERLEAIDASTAEKRAAEILYGLGFNKQKQAKKTRDFSGGWRMRIALVRALFMNPTILLLDEPTNHLDSCRAGRKPDEAVQVGAGTNCFYGRVHCSFWFHGSAKLARQAQSKEKTLAKMERDGLTEKVVKDKVLEFRFADVGKLPPPVLQFVGVTFGYTPDNLIYQNLDFGVDLDSRIALVGPNGAGKSTLLKLMTGDLIPLDGMVRRHNHLRIAQFHQHLAEKLDLEMSALQYMTGNEEERMRSAIGKFGLAWQSFLVPSSFTCYYSQDWLPHGKLHHNAE
ncbi:hypothetical protein B296_00024689, partial [Ensete ventricosum]